MAKPELADHTIRCTGDNTQGGYDKHDVRITQITQVDGSTIPDFLFREFIANGTKESDDISGNGWKVQKFRVTWTDNNGNSYKGLLHDKGAGQFWPTIGSDWLPHLEEKKHKRLEEDKPAE